MRFIIGILAVTLLFLIISSVFSSLISIVVAFLQNHIGGLLIWNSPVWQKIKIPVIILAVVSGLALLIYANHRSQKTREREDRDFALSRGWGYAVNTNDPEGQIAELERKIARVCLSKQYQVSSLMTIDDRNTKITLFDCVYSSRGGGRSNPHVGSACFIESDRLSHLSSQVEVVPRTGLDGALIMKQVNMGDTEFSRNYVVSSKNPEEALKVLEVAVQAALLEQKKMVSSIVHNMEIVFGPGGVVILLYRWPLPHERLALVEMARGLDAALR
jgi:hypothetical protein